MRRIASAAAAVFVAGVLFVPTPTAHATGACIGTGSMSLSSGLPALTQSPGSVGFALALNTGLCARTTGTATTPGAFLYASGVLSGWCNLFSGTGITDWGERFALVGVGDLIVFTGGVTGVVAMTPPASCGSNLFVITGATVMSHCTTKSKGSTQVPVGSSTLSVATKVCVPGALL